MKKSLGSFLLLCLLLSVSVNASAYKWSSFVAKDKAYVGESVYIRYVCEFDDNGQLYIIDFNPRSNDLYDLVLLSKGEKLLEGKRINTYEYILKAKKAQEVVIDVEATMKKTSMASIVDNTTNHYDDTKFDSIHSKTVSRMKKITLKILSSPTKLVGSFTLQVEKDKQELKAYEPYHLDITFSGEGNFDAIKNLKFNIKNVKVFTQKPIKNIRLDKDGYKGSWTQKFAFVSAKDFTISAQSIEYFDVDTGTVRVLKTDTLDIKVKDAYEKKELLDEVKEDFNFDRRYIYCLFTFIIGFLLGKIKFKKKSIQTKMQKFMRKVKNTDTLEALSILMILRNEKKYKNILDLIDSHQLHSLSQAKKMIVKLEK